MNALRAVVVLCVVAFASQAHAVNQKVTFTKTSGTYSNICVILTIGGVNSDWLQLVDGYRYPAATVQNQFNTKYGAGRFIVTYPTTTSVTLEFTGAFGDQEVAYTHVGRWINDEFDTGVSTQYTVTLTQAGSAPPPDPDPDPEEEEEEGAASEATLLEVVALLEDLNAALVAQASRDAQQVFLLQALSQTMGLICGGLLWRTIVVAARLK